MLPPVDVRRKRPPALSFLLRMETLRKATRVISLLALDRSDIPTLPSGHHFIGVWSFDAHGMDFGGVDLAVRYDDAQGLIARGIELYPHPVVVQREPEPFPVNRFAPPPPY